MGNFQYNLSNACLDGDLNRVKQALTKGATINDDHNKALTSSPALSIAAKNGHTHIVRYLLDNKATTGRTGYYDAGKLALHFAAERGHVEICKLLLETGASVEARDLLGNTPVILAGNRQVRNLLSTTKQPSPVYLPVQIDISHRCGCTKGFKISVTIIFISIWFLLFLKPLTG